MKEYLENRIKELKELQINGSLSKQSFLCLDVVIAELKKALDYLTANQ